MSPGKQATDGGPAAAMAAGAELERVRRRVHLSRLALFTAIAAGPAALGLAVLSGPTTVAAAPSAKPTAVCTTAADADPASYAQLFVSAWLRSSTDSSFTVTGAPGVVADQPAPDPPPRPPLALDVRNHHRSRTARTPAKPRLTSSSPGPTKERSSPEQWNPASTRDDTWDLGLPSISHRQRNGPPTPSAARQERSRLGPVRRIT
ncbi:hypothetical protein AB5J72_50985 [Streptomyces sp. CG1]|uniref:hypothetical protein n=1 Tax=Streptomyces sp. CG1 TaxID=1287523 RepID=UPI0034E1EA06